MTHFSRISGQDAKRLIMNKDVNIVDIRDIKSFNEGHITQAEHVDERTLKQFLEDAYQDVDLIVCCYHGNSSQTMAAYFAEQGFEKVHSLDGGYSQWVADHPDLCEKE